MTIKKPIKPTAAEPTAAPVSTGGATIADRFKLDIPQDGAKKGGPAGAAATIAAIVGLVALGVAGVLTFIIYQHWEFLKGA